jgi:uncharacterized protein (DUF952 family)
MSRIFHFISKSDYTAALKEGVLLLPSLHSQGFIHCSLAEQVVDVANLIAPAMRDMVLLEIEESKVIPTIIYENLEGGEKLFPHIYGALNEDAIVSIHPFLWRTPEGYELPVTL